jgi:hypothetical protein
MPSKAKNAIPAEAAGRRRSVPDEKEGGKTIMLPGIAQF